MVQDCEAQAHSGVERGAAQGHSHGNGADVSEHICGSMTRPAGAACLLNTLWDCSSSSGSGSR